MLRYKLIASDFDGTLRHTDGEVSEETKETVREFTSRGGDFCASVRGCMTASILPRAREMGLNGLAVAYQGGVIVDIASGKILRDERIPCSDTVEICRFLEEDNHLHVYDGDRFFVNENDGFLAMYERICRVHGILTPRAGFPYCRGGARVCQQDRCNVRSGETGRAAFPVPCRIRRSLLYHVEYGADGWRLQPKGVDKGTALEFMASYYGIPLAETIGFGDNYNDIPLIRKAGLGIAIGNGVQELKDAAGYVTKSCDEDGVAYAIKKFALGEEE